MPREVILSNGRLLVAFDAHLNLRDLYYPFLGSTNHLMGHPSRLGVWVSGQFTWLNGEWQTSIQYAPRSLVARIETAHPRLDLRLEISAAVHYRENLYVQRVVVHNLAREEREVRLFFHHDPHIYETAIGNTAFYDPELRALLHYKRDRYFLVNGLTQSGEGIFEYATGTKEYRGYEGTWRDAEDGRLEGNPIAPGSVDSTVSFRLSAGPGEKAVLYYWIAAGTRYKEVAQLNAWVLKNRPERLLQETEQYWRTWLSRQKHDLTGLSPEMVELFYRSLLIMKAHSDRNRGGIVASADFDILEFSRDHYGYVWPRDGALVALALSEAGYDEPAREFFQFCREVITERGFLLHKYSSDGSAGSSWHPWVEGGEPQFPIQEDETALVLYALDRYYRRFKDLELVESAYHRLVEKAARFMAGYRDETTGLPKPSYDLWEERRGVLAYTSATVWAGLRSAARLALLLGRSEDAHHWRKAGAEVREAVLHHLYDPRLGRFLRLILPRPEGEPAKDFTLDSSLWGLFAFGLLPAHDPRMERSFQAVVERLWVKEGVGGLARYEQDRYFAVEGLNPETVPGNPWVVCTLWLAQWHIARARSLQDLLPAYRLLEWTVQRASPSGILPEQVHPLTGRPLSVAPLTWSHGTFVLTALQYARRARALTAQERGRR
ncbi:MAG: glycoside hydrolase family 15 protein [Bacillota bacterium]|nr:glycoside hydrolase family 15 protein [Bacillota bacterium]